VADPPDSSSAEEPERTVVWSRSEPAGLPESLPSDQVLAGRFRIVRFLGRGGMGDVYEAEDLELKERVALKTVRPEIARLPGALDRFTREIQLARKVTHPNVCRIFDVSHHGEVTFLTMELLPGETLEGRLRRAGAFREGEALPLVRQMAEGLAAAHRVGVVHRDFKPANVMLVPEPDGGVRAVVTDFGLARAEAAGDGLTLQGDVLGTPAYMSPEQVTAGEITPTTDVYAFGVVLYEMVTGVQPFVGETALSTAVKRLREDPPPPRLRAPGLDPAWEAAILRCLAREPGDRFARIQDAAAALDREPLVDQPTVVLPRQPPKRSWLPWAAALVVLLGIAGGLWIGKGPKAADPLDVLPTELVGEAMPSNPEARELYQKGLEALKRFDALAARDALSEAVEADPNFPLGHSALAEALRRLGDRGEAIQAAKRARDLATGLPSEQRLLIEARVWELEPQWTRAIEAYRKLRELATEKLEYGLGLARVQTAAGRALEALATLEALRGLPPPASEDPRIHLAEAEAREAVSDFEAQKSAASQARMLGEKLGSDLIVARALLLEGDARFNLGEDARELFERAQEAYTAVGDQRGIADALTAVGNVLYRQGKLSEAQPKYEEARGIYEEIGHKGGLASLITNLANVSGERGDLAEAQAKFLEALDLYTALADREGQARVLGNIGHALRLQGDLDGAFQAWNRSLALFQELGDLQGIATQQLGLANAFVDGLELAKAESSFARALDLGKETGDSGKVVEAYIGLGFVQAARGDLEAAHASYQRALTLCRERKDDATAAQVHLLLGSVEIERKRISSAESSANAALKHFQKEEIPDLQAEAEALKARALLDQGKLAEARAAIDRADRHLADSEEPGAGSLVALSAARVLAAEGKTAAALSRLEKALIQARDDRLSALEIRFVQGEIELEQGNRARGRALLQEVERDARKHGFGLIAGKAAKGLA
jgi:serine/threonine protein kinase